MTREAATVRVLMSPELMAEFASRTADGYRVLWDWGEPDADGFHTPTIRVDHEDRIGTLDAAWQEAEAAFPPGIRHELRFGRYWPGDPVTGDVVYWAEGWHIDMDGTDGLAERGSTPAAALTALAERLAQR